jgi:hypothetical protein
LNSTDDRQTCLFISNSGYLSSYPAVSHARLTMALFARRMLLAKLCLLVLVLQRAASSTPMATFPGDAARHEIPTRTASRQGGVGMRTGRTKFSPPNTGGLCLFAIITNKLSYWNMQSNANAYSEMK